ncbi:hypothetical protein WMF26_28730 [Sorangium sp. So ce185]|uniref:hypothetical protein n=1 Tax=Sorangium sp. So ce185 TaxID=3133287 RepID=UPI003F6250AC
MLKKLRLSGVLQSLEVRVRQAVDEQLSHEEFLVRLLSDEVDRRDGRQFDQRARRAGFDHPAPGSAGGRRGRGDSGGDVEHRAPDQPQSGVAFAVAADDAARRRVGDVGLIIGWSSAPGDQEPPPQLPLGQPHRGRVLRDRRAGRGVRGLDHPRYRPAGRACRLPWRLERIVEARQRHSVQRYLVRPDAQH